MYKFNTIKLRVTHNEGKYFIFIYKYNKKEFTPLDHTLHIPNLKIF